jgi:23S rRNA pseudouridine1911/1915/1917 synthase
VLVQPLQGERSGGKNQPLVELLKHYWKAKGLPIANPILVHRLDKETSGLLVLAKTAVAGRHLSRQAAGHFMERRYVAIVQGILEGERGTWRSYIGEGEGGLRQALRPADPDETVRPAPGGDEEEEDGERSGPRRNERGASPGEGKLAITHWTVRRRVAGLTVLDLRLETGRTHQIRVHCAEAGCPIVGDRVYIRLAFMRFPNRPFRDLAVEPTRMMLHAARLKFQHPGRETRWLNFTAPEPVEFEAYLIAFAEARRLAREAKAAAAAAPSEPTVRHRKAKTAPRKSDKPEARGRGRGR